MLRGFKLFTGAEPGPGAQSPSPNGLGARAMFDEISTRVSSEVLYVCTYEDTSTSTSTYIVGHKATCKKQQ